MIDRLHQIEGPQSNKAGLLLIISAACYLLLAAAPQLEK